MALTALILVTVLPTIGLGARVAIQKRRIGTTGVHRFRADSSPLEWAITLLALFSGGAMVLAPVLELLGVLDPIGVLDASAVGVAGLVLFCLGVLLVFGAQMAMGDSWRIGVEPEERTALVTTGVFALVRNPIYSAAIPMTVGYVLMVPNVLAIAAAVAGAAAFELLVRGVEEPYLLEVHGEAYRDYASRVGRFLPGLGLLSARRSATAAS